MTVRLTIADRDYLHITIWRFISPNGAVREETGYVPWTANRESKYAAMLEDGCRLTFESIPGNQASLCVEDDELDFAVSLVANDDDATMRAICALIDGYDLALYARVRASVTATTRRPPEN